MTKTFCDFVCAYICVGSCICMYLSACIEDREDDGWVLIYYSSPIPLRQSLSLNLGSVFYQLSWKSASCSEPAVCPFELRSPDCYIGAGLWTLVHTVMQEALLTTEPSSNPDNFYRHQNVVLDNLYFTGITNRYTAKPTIKRIKSQVTVWRKYLQMYKRIPFKIYEELKNSKIRKQVCWFF